MATKISLEMSNEVSFMVKGASIKIDCTQLSDPAVAAYIFNYGLRKTIADAASGETDKAKVLTICEKRRDDFYAGNKPRAGSGIRTFAGLDADETALHRAAFRKVETAFKTAGIKFDWKEFHVTFAKCEDTAGRSNLMNNSLGKRLAAYKGEGTKARATAVMKAVFKQAAEQVKRDHRQEDELFGL